MGPKPGRCIIAITPLGNCAAQLRRLLRVARLDQRVQLLLERLADARELGHAAVAHELLDGHGGLAHRPGGGAVGEDAVGDGPVELVEIGELLEGGGDLGVRHSPSLRGRHARPGLDRPAHLLRGRQRRRRWSPRCAPRRPPARGSWSSTTRRRTARAGSPTALAARAIRTWPCCTAPAGAGSAPRTSPASPTRSPTAPARVVEIDCDFSHDPALVPVLLDAVRGGADLALGSRYVARRRDRGLGGAGGAPCRGPGTATRAACCACRCAT